MGTDFKQIQDLSQGDVLASGLEVIEPPVRTEYGTVKLKLRRQKLDAVPLTREYLHPFEMVCVRDGA